MKTVHIYRLTALGVLCTAFGIGIGITPAHAEGQGQQGQGQGSAPVTIVGPLPLPVTGTTTVNGSVSVTQSGAWTVGLSGTPSVRNLDEPGRSPYASQCCPFGGPFSISCSGVGSIFCDISGFPPVPAGKRLVVQDVSGHLREPAGCKPDEITVNGSVPAFVRPSPSLGFADSFQFHEPLVNFVDAGSAPTISITSTCGPLQLGLIVISVVGHLVDVP